MAFISGRPFGKARKRPAPPRLKRKTTRNRGRLDLRTQTRGGLTRSNPASIAAWPSKYLEHGRFAVFLGRPAARGVPSNAS